MQSAKVLLLLPLAMPIAYGQALHPQLKDAPVDELKKAYLSCDRAVVKGQLGKAGVMQCSLIYEELKQRAFDGDFLKLHAWSKSQPTSHDTKE
jgi:hypothetical protein